MFGILDLATIVLVLALAYLGYRQRNKEKREWNDGVCAANNTPWRLRDHDSHGGRYYVADDGRTRYATWISWPVDKDNGETAHG